MLIANRGEIAVRIIRAAKALGLHTIQAYSEADFDSLAVRLADEAVHIGPPPAAKSYLNIESLIAAGKRTNADAVHPGYGFLSENADFADAVTDADMIFMGPDGDTIRLLGDKVSARAVAQAAGVSVVPGSDGLVDDLDAGRKVLERMGYPVFIKASAGGGGRGIRIAHDIEEFDFLFPQASAEAKAAFGDGGLYVEKMISGARHIEVQILGDGKNYVHCFERECSVQRRRQKIWEEAPAVNIPETVRKDMCEQALALAEKVRYKGAGTVEFLYQPSTQRFYFIEVNTRIQVEHTITEAITGIDLVQEMIRIADTGRLHINQNAVQIKGHAIECRINAEDPTKDFIPWPGIVKQVQVPEGEDIRFDTYLYPGCTVSPFYDSLLGKIIVYAPDRDACLARLRSVLQDFHITGIPTTLPLHVALADDKDVAAGQFDTHFLESWLEKKFQNAKSDLAEIQR